MHRLPLRESRLLSRQLTSFRRLCTAAPRSVRLTHRGLVRVGGGDSRNFLQGLITADISSLDTQSSLYAMLLNPQGRVLYDVIIYRVSEDEQLVECDSSIIDTIVKHFRRYALRAKVNISAADDEAVWAVFPGLDHSQSYPDPRVSEMGSRVFQQSAIDNTIQATIDDYHVHRMKLGVAEGVNEIPTAKALPLEYNLEFLNGVSFSKGCYIGQELTARTHHTGLVRKRVMPVTMETLPLAPLAAGTPVVNSADKALGKLLTHHGEFGLALLRIKQSFQEDVYVKSPEGEMIKLEPRKPEWWPKGLTIQ